MANASIGLWKTKKENFIVSHKDGLDKDQIEFLHNLKEGDRLRMYFNPEQDKRNKNGPDYAIMKMEADRA